MSINTPGGNEALPPQPSSGNSDGADARPGYPPAGQAETLAALASSEAAADTFDPTQMDAELAALETGTETPEQREQRLSNFVETHFSAVCPPEHRALATGECIAVEDRFRDVWEEPDLRLEDADAEDPALKDAITEKIALTLTYNENEAAIAAATTERDEAITTEATNGATIETNTDNISATRAETAALQATDNQETARNIEVNRDLATVEDLDANFKALKAEHGTIGALRLLLDPETGVKSPEMKAKVQRAVATAGALVSAIPGKEAATEALLNQSGLNLTGASQSEVFANLFTAAEASDEFSAEEVEQLRAVVAGVDADIKTGTDYENAMNETVLDDGGNEIPAHLESDPLAFGVGLDGFTSDDGETQYMRATPEHGQGITLDVTHLSGEEKAVLASYLDTWRMTEDAGESEWLLSLTQYDLRGQSIVDPIKLIEAAQVVNAVYGGFAGYNGEVLRGEEQIGMIRWQAQLRSPKSDAARSDRNSDMTATAMQGLGIQNAQGRLDLDMLRAFGDYSRVNWFGAPDYEAVQAHLAGLFPEKFPDLVEPPERTGDDEDLAA